MCWNVCAFSKKIAPLSIILPCASANCSIFAAKKPPYAKIASVAIPVPATSFSPQPSATKLNFSTIFAVLAFRCSEPDSVSLNCLAMLVILLKGLLVSPSCSSTPTARCEKLLTVSPIV